MAQAKKQGALVRGHNFVWELWKCVVVLWRS